MAEYLRPEGEQRPERPDHGDKLAMGNKPLAEPSRDEIDFLALMRERAVAAEAWWSENFDLAEEDVKFAEGIEQWRPADVAAREGKPCLTINTVGAQIESVCGEQRQNRPSIHVHAADDFGAGLEYQVGKGKQQRKVAGAEFYEGLIRAIEFQSGAEAHYDAAHRYAVDGAFGFLRVLTRYASGRDFDQELLIRRVKNRWSVLLDGAGSTEPDLSDGSFAFIGEDMLRTEYDRRYPSKPVGALVGDVAGFFGARSQSRVRVCEYFTREAKDRELVLLSNGQIQFRDVIEDVLDELARGGPELDPAGNPVLGDDGLPVVREPVEIVRSRTVATWCVYWHKVTANAVLEKARPMPFTTIPIVPVFGRERNLRDGRTIYSSLHRQAKEPARMGNYWWSESTARLGAQSNAPWLATDAAIEGREAQWRAANRGNPAVLIYNEGAEKPERQPPAPMPVAETQMAISMQGMVKDALGLGAPGLTDMSSDASGTALRTRKAAEMTGTFAFTDNLSMALRRVGLLLVEAIPKIYDTERTVRLRNEDGTGEWAKINTVVRDEQTGKEVVINGLGQGEFDVSVSAGPSYATLRQETADNQMEAARINPALMDIAGDKIVEGQDWPDAKGIAMRLRRQMAATAPYLLTQSEVEDLNEGQPEADQQQVGPDGQPMPTPEEQAAQQQAALAEAQQAAAMKVLEAETAAKMAKAEADKAAAEAKALAAQADMMEATLKLQALQTGGLGALKAQPPTSAPGPVQIGSGSDEQQRDRSAHE